MGVRPAARPLQVPAPLFRAGRVATGHSSRYGWGPGVSRRPAGLWAVRASGHRRAGSGRSRSARRCSTNSRCSRRAIPIRLCRPVRHRRSMRLPLAAGNRASASQSRRMGRFANSLSPKRDGRAVAGRLRRRCRAPAVGGGRRRAVRLVQEVGRLVVERRDRASTSLLGLRPAARYSAAGAAPNRSRRGPGYCPRPARWQAASRSKAARRQDGASAASYVIPAKAAIQLLPGRRDEDCRAFAGVTKRQCAELTKVGESPGSFCCPVLPVAAGIRFCCPVRPEPRYRPCNLVREDLSYAARASASLSLALVFWAVAVVPFRAKAALFSTRRSWFGPVRDPGLRRDLWWSRRVLPPGPLRLFTQQFIAISGKPAGTHIGVWRLI